MTDVFDDIFGQPQVRRFLRASCNSSHVAHAYLFSGPAGSNKTLAARAFAQSLVCEQNGCGVCNDCKRVGRATHPDVKMLEPQGASGYLIEQIRDLVHDVNLAPVQAKRKIYIMQHVESLSVSAANAFLKTLEEPPSDVIFILLGRTCDSVLPTISSRCQIVLFRHIPPQEAVGIISQKTGVSRARARASLEACGGSITRAIAFSRSNERLAYRQQVFDCMASLKHADSWDIIVQAKELVLSSKAPLDAVRRMQDEELAQQTDYLQGSARKQIETRNKRILSSLEKENLSQLFSLVQSWLRDMLMIAGGCPEQIINIDVQGALIEAAENCDAGRIVAALQTAEQLSATVAYNVSPQTCVEALMLRTKEEIYG